MKTLETRPAATPTTMTSTERDQALADWQKAHIALAAAKRDERELRDMIVDHSGLFDPDKQEGTQNVELGNGWKIKAVKKLTFTMANKDGETFKALEQLSALGPASARAAKNLCTFSPLLKKSEYNKLEDEEKRIVNQVLTTKPGAPTLTLVPPTE